MERFEQRVEVLELRHGEPRVGRAGARLGVEDGARPHGVHAHGPELLADGVDAGHGGLRLVRDGARREAARVEQHDLRPPPLLGRSPLAEPDQPRPLVRQQQDGLVERAAGAEQPALHLRAPGELQAVRREHAVEPPLVLPGAARLELDLDLVGDDVPAAELVDDDVERDQADEAVPVVRDARRAVLAQPQDGRQRLAARDAADGVGELAGRRAGVALDAHGLVRRPVAVERAERQRGLAVHRPRAEDQPLGQEGARLGVEVDVADADRRERVQREPAELGGLEQRRERAGLASDVRRGRHGWWRARRKLGPGGRLGPAPPPGPARAYAAGAPWTSSASASASPTSASMAPSPWSQKSGSWRSIPRRDRSTCG